MVDAEIRCHAQDAAGGAPQATGQPIPTLGCLFLLISICPGTWFKSSSHLGHPECPMLHALFPLGLAHTSTCASVGTEDSQGSLSPTVTHQEYLQAPCELWAHISTQKAQQHPHRDPEADKAMAASHMPISTSDSQLRCFQPSHVSWL